jgi:hypothetical protein
MSIDFEAAFRPLWGDVVPSESFPERRPLIAHYTSIQTLESIMANDEIWFSNPLYMNDKEELRFGMMEGASAFRSHVGLEKACGTRPRFEILLHAFEHYFSVFDREHAFDTYALCFAEHSPERSDGLLSMWRGYGGNGNGAAIVFDLSKLNVSEASPFIISKVFYASRNERLEWINSKLNELADLIAKLQMPDEELYKAAYAWIERLKAFSIFTKHHGFHEECEWRIVYWSQRDQEKKLGPMLDYWIGPRGLEPRLKFKVTHIEGVTAEDLSLEKLVSQIILGPSLSDFMAMKTVQRMLINLGKETLVERLTASTTPFRAL